MTFSIKSSGSPTAFSMSIPSLTQAPRSAARGSNAQHVGPRVGQPAPKLMSLIGAYPDSGTLRKTSFIEGQLNPEIAAFYSTLQTDVLRAGVEDLPLQGNGWCCGINSSARFLAMLGKPLGDYGSYHNGAPRHHLAACETGPGTKWLVRHMQRDQQTQGLNVWSNMSNDWASQKRAIDGSLAAGRPIMVLIEVSSRCLHWVTLVGRSRENGDYLALNKNGDFAVIESGEDGLRQRMNLDGHIVHKAPMRDDRVACFNSIVADIGPLYNNAGALKRHNHRQANLVGNQNEFANVLESTEEVAMDTFDLVGDGAKAVGNGVEVGAKAVGNGVEVGAKAVGNDIENAAKAIGSFSGGLF